MYVFVIVQASYKHLVPSINKNFAMTTGHRFQHQRLFTECFAKYIALIKQGSGKWITVINIVTIALKQDLLCYNPVDGMFQIATYALLWFLILFFNTGYVYVNAINKFISAILLDIVVDLV